MSDRHEDEGPEGDPDPESPVILESDPDIEPESDTAQEMRPRRRPSIRTTRVAGQLSRVRDERQARMSMPTAPRAAVAGERRVKVPYGIDLAAAWSWRLILIVVATAMLAIALHKLEELVIPIVVAMLITALTAPLVALLQRIGIRRGLASLIVLFIVILVVASLLTLAGQQIANGAKDLSDQTAKGLQQIRDYLTNGPFHIKNDTLNAYIQSAQDKAKEYAEGKGLGQLSSVGSTVGKVFAGLFITLLSTYFFLADGDRIWSWIVRLSPRDARERVDSSGRVAWISLTQFVRATVIVAVTDAILVATAAAILRVPFVLAIGVLVFLGAFIPLVGAVAAGSVAVLVALVDRGPVVALIMAAAVITVQQIEAHGLQPFLMGRWVEVHPLGVIVAIGTGIILAGVAGALVAVPLAAAVNAVGQHLASTAQDPPDPEPA